LLELKDGTDEGITLGSELGLIDGALLTLGDVLGVGLLLGTVLGMSVGHDGVDE
jgi:hypothetical protein